MDINHNEAHPSSTRLGAVFAKNKAAEDFFYSLSEAEQLEIMAKINSVDDKEDN